MGMRFAGAVCALFLGCVSVATAGETDQTGPTIVVRTDAQHLRPAVIEAAEKVCAKALENDKFYDFGTQEECVDETVTQTLGSTGSKAVSQLVAAVK